VNVSSSIPPAGLFRGSLQGNKSQYKGLSILAGFIFAVFLPFCSRKKNLRQLPEPFDQIAGLESFAVIAGKPSTFDPGVHRVPCGLRKKPGRKNLSMV